MAQFQVVRPPTPSNWSTQQNQIFNWFATGTSHLVVRARAGTGKTTTIIEGINRAPDAKILLCAFNRRIAQELQVRLDNPRAQAKTLHAPGFGIVLRNWEHVGVASGSTRADSLTEQVCGGRCPDAIKRLVSKLHCLGREIAPHATRPGHLVDIAINYECEPDETWEQQGWGLDYVTKSALACMELAANVKPIGGIDFSDMIFLPVRNRWLFPQYDLVVVDEAQDMTIAQLEIAQGVCRGRVCIVGDDRQAIYGFRGADSDSLDRLKTELDASELGLTVTYRCGKSIVELAARLVPDFECGPDNPEGTVGSLAGDKLVDAAALGDFVLSRVNAPLVAVAMGLLRNGKRARIAGRDIGSGLKALIRRLGGKNSVPTLLARIAAWEQREVARWTKAGKEARVAAIQDQAETMLHLADGAKSVKDIEERIDALFTDDGLGQAGVVTCSSVHRAKGLEANRVFVLADTLRNGDREEINIQYVAFTRAKTELVMVAGF